ncbi:Armadillo repeat-containing protein 2 [Armadillidium nasatum]|uniref:Armadillo repeat-containing protein 2 n=1 Tax=Armadillidium nasatum TaxID=96803 RepID=A0A5N5TPC8_9CRUS|nr:Armadillo repeat-containing protein 2 [Armadillidium nasatum]
MRKTSAQIIREAKTALDYDNQCKPGLLARVGVKTVNTRRPFTPREKERTLFGNNVVEGLREQRPPSSFTLSPLNFDASDLNNRMSSASLLPRPMSRLLPVLSSNSNDKSGSSISAKRRVHRYQFRPTLIFM